MNEDDIYRTSTQFRFWSFTFSGLAELRTTTNSLAADRVRNAIKRLHAAGQRPSDYVDCLTVSEEQKLIGFYCSKAMDFADFCGFPTAVKATAVQFLKRFYVSNSPMTYHPKQMMPSAIYLATKTENHYIGVQNFAEKLPKTTPEDIIAPEFLLTQGLRFTFDVRHPYRGFEGVTMDLNEIALGSYEGPAGSVVSSGEAQAAMLGLALSGEDRPVARTAGEAQERIKRAHDKSGELLKTSAILTDAYLLYTPAQIGLAALLAADEPLAQFYVRLLFSGAKSVETSNLEARVLGVLTECAALLTSPESRKPGDAEKKELMRIDKKLYQCRNPEKVDLVSMDRAAKGGSVAGMDDEKVVKKRKLERDRAEKEEMDLFGGEISGK